VANAEEEDMSSIMRRDNNETTRTPAEYRWDPLRVMDAFLRWDPYRSDNGLSQYQGDYTPRFDIKETKNAYVIKADLPGLRDEDVNVSLTGSQLTISGKREDERREEGEHHYMVERSAGTFTRTFVLPNGVDADAVSAEMKDGVLTLQIPKRPEAQPKKIAIGRNDGATAGDDKAKA
jgi:HSP20 family protein